MAENQQKRGDFQCGQANPERAKYMEDERLAHCLKDKVFLQKLREDKEFMKELLKDSGGGAEPVWAKPEPQQKLSEKKPEPARAKSKCEDCGEHDQDTSDFRGQLKQMGGSTRKKFMELAKKFFSRKKKKTPKHPKEAEASYQDEDYSSSDDEYYRPGSPDTMGDSPFVYQGSYCYYD